MSLNIHALLSLPRLTIFFIFQEHFYHEWRESLGFSLKLKAQHGWPGKEAVRCLMTQLTRLPSTICTDSKGQMCKEFENKLGEKIGNDNKTRTIKMMNDLEKGDVIMLFYLFNEIHLLKLTLTGNEIAVPRAPESSDEEEDEVAEDTSPSPSTSHYKPSGKLDPNEMLDTFG